MDQIEFEKTISEFQKIEDARDQLWDRAKVLIEKGFEVEAYILILATWNFARFRYFMKNFDLREFQAVINRVNPVFKKLENTHFENIDFTDNTVVIDIKFIYNQLKKIAEQTGASKIMALKNSKLFVMWDTEIRKIYKIDNKGEADDYIHFLIKMQKCFENIKWSGKIPPLAKAIDEYNYVIADRNRGVRKSKSKQN
ncbi:MAG: hypothetical protein WC618_03195 [Patescibacteria group bacterium]